jgi:hypothetical protein
MSNLATLVKTTARRPRGVPRRYLRTTKSGLALWLSTTGAFEVLALLVIAFLLILGAALAGAPRAATPAMSELRVQAGDSMWALAAAHPVEGLTTAQVADLMTKANHLDGRPIVQGQTILAPATSRDQRVAVR